MDALNQDRNSNSMMAEEGERMQLRSMVDRTKENSGERSEPTLIQPRTTGKS